MKKIVLMLIVATLCIPAYAASITTYDPAVTNWVGALGTAPSLETARLVTNTADGNTPYVSEGNWGSGGSRLGQTFTAPESGNIDKLAICIAGSPSQFALAFYDMGTTYAGQQTNPWTIDTTTLTNMWVPSIQVTYYGSAADTLMVLDLEGAEEVALIAGHKYFLRITLISTDGTLYIKRGGVPTDYMGVGGTSYRADGTSTLSVLNGANRMWGVAYTIPEPATIALLSLGLTLLRKRS